MEQRVGESSLLSEADPDHVRGAAERSALENERVRKELARRLEAA